MIYKVRAVMGEKESNDLLSLRSFIETCIDNDKKCMLSAYDNDGNEIRFVYFREPFDVVYFYTGYKWGLLESCNNSKINLDE